MERRLLCAILGLFALTLNAQNIIPKPVEFTYTRALPFKLTAATTIGGNSAEAQLVASQLASAISKSSGFSFKIRPVGNIQFNINKVNNATIGDEGYTLDVNTQTITINANKPAGLFYGVQTLLQLFTKRLKINPLRRAIGRLRGVVSPIIRVLVGAG